MAPKMTRGRQKIEIRRITDENSLAVSFAKRNAGICKKSSELCTLCGVEIAIIMFSPTQKVFSFGHPTVDEILDRFLNKIPPHSTDTSDLMRQYRNRNIQELNEQLTHLLAQLDVEKNISQKHNKKGKARQQNYLWEAPMENFGIEDLQKLKVLMHEIKNNCEKEVENIMAEVTIPTVLGGGGSWM